MSENDEIVGEFLVESYENLDRYDDDLLALERDPTDTSVLGSIFRTIHTVKGTSGFFGFDRLESLTHVAENLLGKLRAGEAAVTEEVTNALLATGDVLRRMLTLIEETGVEGEVDVTALVATLVALNEADHDGATPPAAVDEAEAPEASRLGKMLIERGVAHADDVTFAAQEQEGGDSRRIGDILIDECGVDPDEVESTVREQFRTAGRGLADTSIRVGVGVLDELMNLVGELVLARNQIGQLVTAEQDSGFAGASQRLDLITTELQERVAKTRMQAIGNVWNKLPRVVRDLSQASGKRIELEMVGQETELDKTIIEAIKDPLTHLVRNAVDHGIETPKARAAAGKSEAGHLSLRAYHAGGQVIIEIADDGGGIDAEKIRAEAVHKGIITADQAAQLPERAARLLIFAAGFSTAETVTNVSGRGVGMDVVRTNIERIGGTVDVHTELGVGTTFRVTIPLTLAIVPALMVSSGGERYAIPQLSLLELLRLEGEGARQGIELVHRTPVLRRRGRLLPIVDLSAELANDGDPLSERRVVSIVVLHTDGRQFGLVVDDIHDTQEIVVKPLGPHLEDASLFAGATIMGDGRVSLILDIGGIAQRARILAEGHDRSAPTDEYPDVEKDTDRCTLLLVEVGEGRRAAIALSAVERLEEFPTDAVERSGSSEVVQYRNDILPLLRLGDVLGHGDPVDPEQPIKVVVLHTIDGRGVGLVVSRIIDIVEQEGSFEDADDRAGLLGSAIIQGRVTDAVDVDAIVAANDPARVAAGPVFGA